MTVGKIWGSKCVYCGNEEYEVINGWEWRSLKFHCQIMCKDCCATIHTYGITPKRALHKGFNILYERGKKNDR